MLSVVILYEYGDVVDENVDGNSDENDGSTDRVDGSEDSVGNCGDGTSGEDDAANTMRSMSTCHAGHR